MKSRKTQNSSDNSHEEDNLLATAIGVDHERQPKARFSQAMCMTSAGDAK